MQTNNWATSLQLATASAVLRSEDVSDLKWYFRSGGITNLTGSNWGAALEKLSMFAYGCAECEDCGGSRKKKIPGDGLERKRRTEQPTDEQSKLLALIDEKLAKKIAAAAPELTGEWCTSCAGRGMIPRTSRTNLHGSPTARPTGSSKKGRGGREADHGDLARLGSVTRRLSKLDEEHPGAADVLELYYGPDHDGTTVPLYQLVPAGRTLMKRNGQRLQWRQFFENELKDARDKNDAQRLALFEEAKRQAGELYRAACQAWNSVHRPKPRVVSAPGEQT